MEHQRFLSPLVSLEVVLQAQSVSTGSTALLLVGKVWPDAIWPVPTYSLTDRIVELVELLAKQVKFVHKVLASLLMLRLDAALLVLQARLVKRVFVFAHRVKWTVVVPVLFWLQALRIVGHVGMLVRQGQPACKGSVLVLVGNPIAAVPASIRTALTSIVVLVEMLAVLDFSVMLGNVCVPAARLTAAERVSTLTLTPIIVVLVARSACVPKVVTKVSVFVHQDLTFVDLEPMLRV